MTEIEYICYVVNQWAPDKPYRIICYTEYSSLDPADQYPIIERIDPHPGLTRDRLISDQYLNNKCELIHRPAWLTDQIIALLEAADLITTQDDSNAYRMVNVADRNPANAFPVSAGNSFPLQASNHTHP